MNLVHPYFIEMFILILILTPRFVAIHLLTQLQHTIDA
jgi:hypothetical protein